MRTHIIILLLLLIGCLGIIYFRQTKLIENIAGKKHKACQRKTKLTRDIIARMGETNIPMTQYESLYHSNACVPKRIRRGRNIEKVCHCAGHGTKPAQWFPGGACSAQDKSL